MLAYPRCYGVHSVGKVDGIVERFFLISPERRIKKAALLAVSDAAKSGLFALV